MKKQFQFFLLIAALSVCAAAQADTGVTMNLVDENGVGKEIGQITISETQYGLVLSPALTDPGRRDRGRPRTSKIGGWGKAGGQVDRILLPP